jgi:glycosyltransferase involved in cell wall biosynthesis
MKVTKVAHILRRFSCNKWGGTESVVYNICRQLQQRGVDTVIFCTDMFSSAGTEWIDGIPVKRFSYVFPWFFLSKEAKRQMQLKGGSPLSLSLFWGLLRESNLSLIHTHVQHRLGGIARTVARLKGIPYVVSIHGGYFTIAPDHAAKMQQPFKKKWEWGKIFGWLFGARRTLRDADAILCVGSDEYEIMKREFPDKLVYYLPNGVAEDRFIDADPCYFRQVAGFGTHEKYILCVSRIDYQKNQILLVRAFAKFAQFHSEYKLVLIGPINVEAYFNEIMDVAQKLKVKEKLVFIPGYTPDDPLLSSAYRGADMFVLPSKTEPFGIVILEAWSAGVPVIASRVGGIPGFTHHREDILLFKDDNEDELTALMEEMASCGDLRGGLIQKGFQEAQNYSWPKVVDDLMSVYIEL